MLTTKNYLFIEIFFNRFFLITVRATPEISSEL